jgi:hypothetical protein
MPVKSALRAAGANGISCYRAGMIDNVRRSGPRWLCFLSLAAGVAAGCGDVNGALGQLSEARRLSADLQIEFTRAADAANRAVMADTDPASVASAQEAEAAKQAIRKDLDALRPVLEHLKYAEEIRLLQEFATRFGEYDALDRRILDLAVENTNLKAQRLSFGPVQVAADAFRDSLETAVAAKDPWRVKALAETAVAAVREIQALQAPHIAEPEDASMTRLEQRMAAAETVARHALQTLAPLVEPGSRPKLASAGTTLDQFMALNAQIVALSRRNTNVRSLALSLDQKRRLVEPCEEALRALRDALNKHGYPAGRYLSDLPAREKAVKSP